MLLRHCLLLVALSLLFSAEAVGAEKHTHPNKKLIVGTKVAPPFAIKTAQGAWTGISIDLWRRIASDLNIAFELRELDLRGLIDGVTKGTVDLAVAALTITPEREKAFDFTHPFYTTGLSCPYREP